MIGKSAEVVGALPELHLLQQDLCLQEHADQLLSNPPPDPDAAIRQDLTHHEVITVDDASTRDIDDGLAVESLPEGGQRLWVHIADPTRWVRQGDPLDVEARRRAKTLYLPTGNFPLNDNLLVTGVLLCDCQVVNLS